MAHCTLCHRVVPPQEKWRSCPCGLQCRGFNLPAKAVIHTVGPVYYEDEAAECRAELTSAYRECLQIASKQVCSMFLSRQQAVARPRCCMCLGHILFLTTFGICLQMHV